MAEMSEGGRSLEDRARDSPPNRSASAALQSSSSKKHPKFRSLMHYYVHNNTPPFPSVNGKYELGREMHLDRNIIMQGARKRRQRPTRCLSEVNLDLGKENGNADVSEVRGETEKFVIIGQNIDVLPEGGRVVTKKRTKLKKFSEVRGETEKLVIIGQNIDILPEGGRIVTKKRTKLKNCLSDGKGFDGRVKIKALKMLKDEQNGSEEMPLTSERAKKFGVNNERSNCEISDGQIIPSGDLVHMQEIWREDYSASENCSERENQEAIVNVRKTLPEIGFATFSSIRRFTIGSNKKQKQRNLTLLRNGWCKKKGASVINGVDFEGKLSSGLALQENSRTSVLKVSLNFEAEGSVSSMAKMHERYSEQEHSQRSFTTVCDTIVNGDTNTDAGQTISAILDDSLKSAECLRSSPVRKRKKRKRCHSQLQNSNCQSIASDSYSSEHSQNNEIFHKPEVRFSSNANYLNNFSKLAAPHINLEMEDRDEDKDFKSWQGDPIDEDCLFSRTTSLSDTAHVKHHSNTTTSSQELENTDMKLAIPVNISPKSARTTKTSKSAKSKSHSPKLQMSRGMRRYAGLVHGAATTRTTKRAARKSFPFKASAQRISNLLSQKPLQVKWREVHIGLIDPTYLVSNRCKVYWPKDDEWYTGFISEYNKHTKKHRIIYDDEEEEWLLLLKERLALHISLHEKVAMALGSKEEVRKGSKRKQVIEELAVLAASMEDFQGDYHHGDIVWAEIKGYPMWPAFVMDEDHATTFGLELTSCTSMIPVQFFGSHDCARISPRQMVILSQGLLLNYHLKCKRVAFRQGLEEVERYLKDRKLPRSMALLQEEVAGSLAQERKVKKQEAHNDNEDFMGDERKFKIKKSINTLFTCPIVLGSLCVLSLGKIVKDSEYFHDHKYIWTEGYTAIRKFSSIKDPCKVINYRMDILRSPIMRSLPLFRVTPDDDDVVERPSASACWKRIFDRLYKVKCSSAENASGQAEKKRPVYKSGPTMFGFANAQVSRLIQGLPNARACSKFIAWSEMVPRDETEELLPAGFKPVEVHWKHLDRCSVCYTNEEYEGNVLLQCDKCRMLVHINCYGDLERLDGDLSLCKLCQPGAPVCSPPCCLCPIKGGAMKETTDGRWVHLACALWIPETCFADIKRMEPVDGLRSINKERWKLICSICKVPYGVCIQCAEHNCRVAYHPLCARAAGFYTEILTTRRRKENGSAGGADDVATPVRLLSYCRRHRQPREGNMIEVTSQAFLDHFDAGKLHYSQNSAGCARCEPYNTITRRGRREPEAHAAALAKRSFVENRAYIVNGSRGISYKNSILSDNLLLSSQKQHDLVGELEMSTFLKQQKAGHASISVDDEVSQVVLSMSARFCNMRSTVHQRLTFGKSGIHGWGLFTKQAHAAGDMVIEYAGEIVRPVIADIRERNCYDSLVGVGTYMFCIDEDRVIDATRSGSIAHLINHSCEPNCYSRVVAACGKDRIIIFAKRGIAEHEEVTYDYRFTSIGEQLTCHCGCLGCRGIVNLMDDQEDSTRILVSYTDLSPWPYRFLERPKSPVESQKGDKGV